MRAIFSVSSISSLERNSISLSSIYKIQFSAKPKLNKSGKFSIEFGRMKAITAHFILRLKHDSVHKSMLTGSKRTVFSFQNDGFCAFSE